MAKPFDVEAEELIRRAATLPRVRVQLRGRVLFAARQARRRRWMRRTGFCAAALVLLAAGVGVWNSCWWSGDCAGIVADQPQREPAGHEPAYARPPAIHAGIGQWDHVDAEVDRRGHERQTVVDFLTGSK